MQNGEKLFHNFICRKHKEPKCNLESDCHIFSLGWFYIKSIPYMQFISRDNVKLLNIPNAGFFQIFLFTKKELLLRKYFSLKNIRLHHQLQS